MIHREESDSPTKERLLGSDPAEGEAGSRDEGSEATEGGWWAVLDLNQ